MKLKFIILFSSVLCFHAGLNIDAQYNEIHCKHFIYGYPKGSPATNDLIIRDAYALSSDDSTKFAEWVAYLVDSVSIQGDKKDRKWAADPWLGENETLEPNDYTGAAEALKVDRGHQAALASVKGARDWESSNYLSNITPQRSILNQGLWKNVEDLERDLVAVYGKVYVLTGTLYQKAMPPLPKADEPHVVPSGYWKVVTVFKPDGSPETISFMFSQDTPKNDDIKKYITSIDEIEKAAHLDIFPEMDEQKEKKLESAKSTKLLPTRK
jgi:endonuclease G, mitochondrial